MSPILVFHRRLEPRLDDSVDYVTQVTPRQGVFERFFFAFGKAEVTSVHGRRDYSGRVTYENRILAVNFEEWLIADELFGGRR